jgi:predicted component of type VI protein secretion system
MNRLILLAAAMITGVAACASNKAADEPGTRIRDSSTTTQNTVNPSDTLTHIRDTVPDSTGR